MGVLFRVETDLASLTWSGPDGGSTASSASSAGRLALSPRRPGLEFGSSTWRAGVPKPVAGDPKQEAGPALFEETPYNLLVEGKGGRAVELRNRDPRVVAGLARSPDGATVYGPVNFRSQVGRSRFFLLVDGRPELDMEVEVFPSKLDYERDFEEITADIQEILTGLALEFLRATYRMASPGPQQAPTELEWVLLLKHFASELDQALRYIEQHPRRGLGRTERLLRVERIRRQDAHVRRSVSRDRGVGERVPLRAGISVRARIEELKAVPTLDTPEHRWLREQLERMERQLARIRAKTARRRAHREKLGQDPASERIILEELQALSRRITRLKSIEPLQEARGLPPSGFSSLQLQGAPGYREAFQCCLRLSLGLRLSGGPLELSLKDLHLLYEYWCFLAVVRLVADVLEIPLDAKSLLSIEADGLRVRLQAGREHSVAFAGEKGRVLRVIYGPEFGGDDVLLSQKPDIVLSLESEQWPTIRLILDAKYRIDTSKRYLEQMRSPGPPPDAINVLHRYRDAILEKDPASDPSGPGKRTVIEGVALFPYQPMVGEDFRNSRLWESLERLGIGGLPFLPGEQEYVRSWLESVLRRSGWEVADKAVPVAIHDRVRDWRIAASKTVLVGVLRGDSPRAHLDWIHENRVYYTAMTPTQPLQYRVQWVTFYESAAIREPGAVTQCAPVVGIEVIPREAIKTPWPSIGRRNELQVLYRLGEAQPLPRAILNQDDEGRGVRFSQNRWTSKLALERATRLTELFLETEPEWRLFDALRTAGVVFKLRPGPPKPKSPQSPEGRVWFHASKGRAQYRGGAGWYCEPVSGPPVFFSQVRSVVEWLGG